MAPDVYVPLWRAFVATNAQALAEWTIGDVGRLVLDPRDVVAGMRDPKGTLPSRQQRAEIARSLLWTAFTITLMDHGWTLCASPLGNALQSGVHTLNPTALAAEMAGAAGHGIVLHVSGCAKGCAHPKPARGTTCV